VERACCRVERGLEGRFPSLEECPSSFITDEVEAGSFVPIGGVSSIKCSTDCTRSSTELGREKSKVDKVRVMCPWGVGSRGVV